MDVLIALVTLVAGLAVGWLLAARHADVASRVALTEVTRLQAVLDAERRAAAERADNAQRTEQQLRETFGDRWPARPWPATAKR